MLLLCRMGAIYGQLRIVYGTHLRSSTQTRLAGLHVAQSGVGLGGCHLRSDLVDFPPRRPNFSHPFIPRPVKQGTGLVVRLAVMANRKRERELPALSPFET